MLAFFVRNQLIVEFMRNRQKIIAVSFISSVKLVNF